MHGKLNLYIERLGTEICSFSITVKYFLFKAFNKRVQGRTENTIRNHKLHEKTTFGVVVNNSLLIKAYLS